MRFDPLYCPVNLSGHVRHQVEMGDLLAGAGPYWCCHCGQQVDWDAGGLLVMVSWTVVEEP